jgi:hypothetical protein
MYEIPYILVLSKVRPLDSRSGGLSAAAGALPFKPHWPRHHTIAFSHSGNATRVEAMAPLAALGPLPCNDRMVDAPLGEAAGRADS